MTSYTRIVRLTLPVTAKPSTLMEFADSLERWQGAELDQGIWIPSVDDDLLGDLRDGELPLPDALAQERLTRRLLQTLKQLEPLGIVDPRDFAEPPPEVAHGSASREIPILMEFRLDPHKLGLPGTRDEYFDEAMRRLKASAPAGLIRKVEYTQESVDEEEV